MPMPTESPRPHGEVFLDARGSGRALRLTWHHEADVVVLSLWRSDVCAGTFRLAASDVDAFVDALVDGLRDSRLAGRDDGDAPHTGEQATFSSWAFGDVEPRASA